MLVDNLGVLNRLLDDLAVAVLILIHKRIMAGNDEGVYHVSFHDLVVHLEHLAAGELGSS